MPHVDLPLEQLRDYRPELSEPADLGAFWRATLDHGGRGHRPAPSYEPADSPLRTVDVLDVTFGGYQGQPVSGWLLLPRGRHGPLPCVVEYVGYGGGRGLPHEWLDWSALGYAHFVMDTRGQGSAWRTGDTADLVAAGATPHAPGFLTLGLPDPELVYYRRLYTDAVQAVHAAAAHPDVDERLVLVSGSSQGGGLALAVGALRGWLMDDPVAALLADVPFLADFRHAAEVALEGPYLELVTWCSTHRSRVEDAFNALSYFDVAVLSQHAVAPGLFSVALRDGVCPPSTVFAAFNHYAGEKSIQVWEWNEHEGGDAHHRLEQVRWLADRVPPGL